MSTYAVVFPGQGSQSIGMLRDLASHFPLVEELFAIVSKRLEYDLWQLIQSGPEDKLNQTIHTQVAMLTADVAVYRVLQSQGMSNAKIMAGHSLGEYAALVCADAIDLADAASLVSMRGKLMQEAVPLGLGAMAAIVGMTDEQVNLICEQSSTMDEQVTPANYNAIGQVVIAGHAHAVEQAMNLALEMGAGLVKRLPVSVPCHCPLLKSAASLFEKSLASTQFSVPKIPVLSNVDLSIYTSVDQIRTLLQQQLYQPVRWVETIQTIKKSGVELIIECGPGKVLSGLTKRIDKSLQTVSVNDQASLDILRSVAF